MKINFTKMEGLGNDYVYIDQTKETLKCDLGELAKKLSDRHFGIGSDGIILIKNSINCDFRMQMFNQDGTEAEMCGNGIRCVGKFVYDKGLTNKTHLSIETKAGTKYLDLLINNTTNTVSEVRVNMGSPIFDPKLVPYVPQIALQNKLFLSYKGESFVFTPVSMGNPHAVTFVNDVDNFDVEKYGKFFEVHEAFPNKANIEFIEIIDKHTLKMRVWERGTGETFACGTGACAAVVASKIIGYTDGTVTVILPGGKLKISYGNKSSKVLMTGPAKIVFDGVIEI